MFPSLTLSALTAKKCNVGWILTNVLFKNISHYSKHRLNTNTEKPLLVEKASFIENYLEQELNAFRYKYNCSFNASDNHLSSSFPFSIQSEVKVEILDVINSGRDLSTYFSLGSVGVGILCKDNSWLILVPLALPGENVLVKIMENGPGLSTSRLVSIISNPSPKRSEPKCIHFGECNSCNLQHLSYSEQLKLKEASIKSIFNDVLKDNASVYEPILPSPLQYGFRNKMTPHHNRPYYKPPNNISSIGFNDVNGKLVDIKSCSVIDLSINKAYQNLRNDLHEKWKNQDNPSQGQGSALLLRRRIRISPNSSLKLLNGLEENNTFKEHKDVIVGNGPDIICSEVIDGITFNYAACNFFQTNPKAITECIKLLRTELKKNYSHLTHLLDLYCGVGLFSILLQSLFTKVVGIESDSRAVQFARSNAKNIPGQDRTLSTVLPLKFISGDASSWLQSQKLISFLPANKTVVILDPPRAGCSNSMIDGLLQYSPQLIVYISCYPLTQAADILKLLSMYRIRLIQPMDFFPQSHHVENMVFLEKQTNN